jgi:L-threonylcarbamoyladenylate synthase
VSAPLAPGDAERLAGCVAGGGVAVFPTDTVYGVCCDAEDERAARRIYELKGRPPERPAAVMFFTLDTALRGLPPLEPAERRALEVLLPGPVTLLLANRDRRFAPACGPDRDTVGVRVPALPEHLRALASVPGALLQTSANLSGGPDARRLDEIPPALLAAVDLALDGGELPGVSSTVIDLRDYSSKRRWRVVRDGALPGDAVRASLGEPI